MVNLAAKDLKDILEINSDLLACRTLDELRMRAMASMRRILDADSSVFFTVSHTEECPNIDRGLAYGADEKVLANYHDHYMNLDPFLSRAMNEKFSCRFPIIVSDQLVNYRSFERTEFYNDFFRPISVHSILGITLNCGARSIGLLAVHRPRNARRFNQHDQARARLAIPGLSAALQRIMTLEKIDERDWLLDNLVPELPCEGVVVLDSELNPIYCDARAHDLLRVLSGNSLNSVEIPEPVRRVCTRLMEGPDQAVNFSAPRIELDYQGANKLGARVRLASAGTRGVRLIVCFEKEQKSLVCGHKLKALGLTRREIDIVQLVCLGQTSCQIAENLRISERTVENHLRSIYTKSGVHSRTRLIYHLIADH